MTFMDETFYEETMALDNKLFKRKNSSYFGGNLTALEDFL